MSLTAAEQQELAELEELERLEKQAAGGAEGSISPLFDTVVQEMHPSFSSTDRGVVKNFSTSPQASMAYLQDKYPELEITHQNGQIRAKLPSEKVWKVLDPQTGVDPTSWEGVKEIGRDIGDVAYDIPAGAASSLAGAAAAIPAGIATGGAGALPAAMAASGATSAGAEALRQKIGQWAGLPQEVSGKDVAISGALGAAGPLAFGAGVGKVALEQGAKSAGKELTAEALQKLLGSYRGLPGRAMDAAGGTLLPAYGKMAGGIPSETTKSLRKYLPEIQAMESQGVTGPVEEVHSRIVGGLAQAKRDVGQRLEAAIDNSGKQVDLAKIRAPLEKAIADAQAEAGSLNNKAMNERVASLKQSYDDLFIQPQAAGVEGPGAPLSDKISAKAAFNLQDQLKDMAELYKTGQGPMARFGAGATSGEKQTAEVMRDAYGIVNDELNQATQGLSAKLKEQYRNYSVIQKDLQPLFKTPEKTFATLSTLAKRDKKFLFEKLKGIQEELGIPIVDDAQKLEAFQTFSNPALMAQSGLGTTSTSRTVPLSTVLGSLGALAGYKTGGGYSGAAVGGLLGTKLGQYAGSPHAIRTAVELERALQGARAGMGAATQPTLFGGGRSAWQAMQEQDE